MTKTVNKKQRSLRRHAKYTRYHIKRWVCQVLDGRLRFEVLQKRVKKSKRALDVISNFLLKKYNFAD
jgi:hypothetical protein